jgi:hypothetical protein
MATIKTLGCGGRFSTHQFFPCFLCVSKSKPGTCYLICRITRTKPHLEWFSLNPEHRRKLKYNKVVDENND